MQKSITQRASNYVATMPPSASGSGGHDAIFNVALVLTKGFSLDEAEAFSVLERWNDANSTPPWGERDLRHKLKSASASTKPSGYLLGGSDRIQSTRPTTPQHETTADEKARKRQSWPALEILTDDDCRQLLHGRPFLGSVAVWLTSSPAPAATTYAPTLAASSAPSLGKGRWGGHETYIISTNTFRQHRRLDGLRFDGGSKTMNAPGSIAGGFVHNITRGGSKPVVVVEGVIGYLEALTALSYAGLNFQDWQIAAAHSCGSRFANDPNLLAAMAGRVVRIIRDSDAAGHKAAEIWGAELHAVGCQVEIIDLPEGIKDLGELLEKAIAEGDESDLIAIFASEGGVA